MINKIFEKALELCHIAKRDEILYGNVYVELGERSIKIINPKDIVVGINNSVVPVYGKSILENYSNNFLEQSILEMELNLKHQGY